jgi:hypothetical protein
LLGGKATIDRLASRLASSRRRSGVVPEALIAIERSMRRGRPSHPFLSGRRYADLEKSFNVCPRPKQLSSECEK